MALVSFTFLLTLEYQNALAGTPDIVCRGFDPCNGTSAGEVMAGDSGPNRINGQGGNDHVVGHGGNDELNGGYGDDSVEGNNGNDELNGGFFHKINLHYIDIMWLTFSISCMGNLYKFGIMLHFCNVFCTTIAQA